MKHINKTYKAAVILAMVFTTSCSDPEHISPNLDANKITVGANVLFVNASPDAPSLDLLVNNEKVGTSLLAGESQAEYVSIELTGIFYAGGSTSAAANTNFRAGGSLEDIGGVLGSNDLIYRAGNNNSNNFVAAKDARYTIIALDSISRPKPVRFTNASGFPVATYFNQLTGKYISADDRAELTAEQQAKTISIGTVPLGASDPGGLRFLLLTDSKPAFAVGNTTQSGIRFINASPNTNVWARLVGNPAGPATIGIGTNVSYILSVAGGFNPSVGSRTTTSAFTLQTTATNTYDLEVSTNGTDWTVLNASPLSFDVNNGYTIYVYGLKGDLGYGIAEHTF